VAPTFDRAALAGRAGLVTGAGSGIGRATALALVAAGADVLVVDVDEEGGEETVELADGPGRAAFFAADVVDPVQAGDLVAATLERFGRLDFAHNNAGVVFAGSPLHEVSDADWKRMIDVDLTGVFNCMRAEIPPMLAARSGSIVNTASGVGVVGLPGQGPYVAAKHGVVGLTRVADPELRGLIEAGHPVGRLGRSEEIADAVVWLVSDASTFVTGQPILVDGGYTAQ
jgi:NAD(P)-dependent dehydrogenase (short-subunit alcohol dehydrogenase family)